MNCRTVQGSLSTSLDRRLPESERRAMDLHLASCRECVRYGRELTGLQSSLKDLPRFSAPDELTGRLRVAASYEVARHQGNADFSTAAWRWWTRARLAVRDMMRPLAVPAAGGLLSSVVCFVMLVGNLGFTLPMPVDDIPLGFTTQVEVDQLSPFGYTGRDVVIELTIDKTGHVANYATHGKFTRDDLKQLGNLLLFTSFAPATVSGQPTSGKILLSSHRINVRG